MTTEGPVPDNIIPIRPDRTALMVTDQERRTIAAALDIASSVSFALDETRQTLVMRDLRSLVLGDLAFTVAA